MSLITRTYKDLDLNFTKHPITKDIAKKTDIAAIAGAMQNLFQTSNYERLFHPDLGCSLKQMLFQPVDSGSSTHIEYIIKQTINNFEPRVEISSTTAIPSPDENGYKIRLEFFVINNPDPITINFFLERIR